MIDPAALANELVAAVADRRIITPPSARDASFDLAAAYAVADEIVRRRTVAGRRTTGVKVGYANKAIWRALKLDTLVWGAMYDDTVRHAPTGEPASLPLTRMISPKIEPEIVFRMKAPVPEQGADAAAVLAAVESIALGFEIIDCPFPGWKFEPVDFVAAFGLHAALVVGTPLRIDSADIPALIDQLARCTVRLSKNDEVAAEGSGRNALRNPALCVAELVSAMARRNAAVRLGPGDFVSTGTLTESQPIVAGQRWSAVVEGIELAPVTVQTTG